MLALLAAMTVTATPVVELVPDPHAITQAAPTCASKGVTQAMGPSLYRRDNPVGAAPLGKMPPAMMLYAVNRNVNGCPVLTVVNRDVEGRGAPAKPVDAPGRRR